MPRARKKVRDFRGEKVSALEAAKFLNLPERSFYRLVETGVIPKSGDGEYILGDVVEAYWKSCFDSEGLTAARTRLVTAQAELAEAELAEARGELHRAAAVIRVWAEIVMNAKTRLLSIPTKHAPELLGKDLQTIKTRLKEAISEALHELSEYDSRRIARATAALRE